MERLATECRRGVRSYGSGVSRRDTKDFEPLPAILVVAAAVFVAAAFAFFHSGDRLTGAVFVAVAIGFLVVGALLWVWLNRRDS